MIHVDQTDGSIVLKKPFEALRNLGTFAGESTANLLMPQHQQYMKRCLDLAIKGSPDTWPNPLVGSVVVHDEKIIGEGFHKRLGEAHAEVNAIKSVIDKKLLRRSTLYVNLEPCSHHGKTPPCADLIIESKIPKVVCAMADPNPRVAGSGIKRLVDAGVNVVLGTMEKEAQELNRSFATFHREKRPYILLKWARTADGYMARSKDDPGSRQISCSASNIFVHQLRAQSGAIVIGSTTAIKDNPSLTTRLVSGRSPHRIVLGDRSKLPDDLILLTDGNPTHIIGGDRESSFEELKAFCVDHQYTQVLVEGGPTVLRWFVETGNWDEAIEIVSPSEWNRGINAPQISSDLLFDECMLDIDVVRTYRNT